jgi:murein DD-endopeptidase MepM/ murein hydrolase activator NlpD
VLRRLVFLLPLALVVALGPAGAEGPASAPGAAATAWAIKVTVPGSNAAASPTVVSPPDVAPNVGGLFQYPADGSVLTAQSTTATATTTITQNAASKAQSVVTGLSLFKGEITADGVTASTSAGTGPSGAGGNTLGTAVTNLKITGQPLGTGVSKANLGTWGVLTLGTQGVDRSAPAGARGYRGFVTELDIRLTADHGGLPAGSEIQVGYAESAVQTAPPPVTTTTATTTDVVPTTVQDPQSGDAPRLRPNKSNPEKGVPLRLHPKLTAGHYVFPVYGPVSYIDSYGSARADVTYHHGDDIFGQLGQPLLAVTDGTVFSVGWNKIGGNRLWILDSQGNQFYYAHLSAFSTAATNGAHVKAGQVVGFMGDTGDAEGTPYHLHFEIHPVSLLYLGYDGAVDPTKYLDAWKHAKDLAFPTAAGWVPVVPGGPAPPEPGAILLGMSDISTADGLDPSSLERALTPLKPSALMQTLVPTVPAPTKDLGRG